MLRSWRCCAHHPPPLCFFPAREGNVGIHVALWNGFATVPHQSIILGANHCVPLPKRLESGNPGEKHRISLQKLQKGGKAGANARTSLPRRLETGKAGAKHYILLPNLQKCVDPGANHCIPLPNLQKSGKAGANARASLPKRLETGKTGAKHGIPLPKRGKSGAAGANHRNNINSLESFFRHLKDNLRMHRGLSLQHRNTSLNGA